MSTIEEAARRLTQLTGSSVEGLSASAAEPKPAAPIQHFYATLTPPADLPVEQSPQAAARTRLRLQRTSSERWQMPSSLLLSLLIHALLLSLTFGDQVLGLPGLAFPWQERRAQVPEFRLVLVPARITNAVPAIDTVRRPTQQASIEPPVAGEGASTPSASSAPLRALEIVTAAKPSAESRPRQAVAPPAKASPRSGESRDAVPAKTPKTAAIDVARPDIPKQVVPGALSGPDVITAAPNTWSPETVMPAHPDPGALARERIDQEVLERAAALAKQADQLEAARVGAARIAAEKREAELREEAARVDAARLQAEREEATRLAAARLEAQRQEAMRQEAAARIEAERQAAAQLEAERLVAAGQEAARVEAARAAQLEAERQEAARQEAAARTEAARRAAAQLEAERQLAARQETPRVEAAPTTPSARVEQAPTTPPARVEATPTPPQAQLQEPARQEGPRAEPARPEAARQEPARQEPARPAPAPQEIARGEAEKEEEAKREERRRAIGRQLDEEARKRQAANDARQLPLSLSTARRVRLWGRSDPNVELVQYAEGWARKIQFNTPVATVRELAKQPHRHPMVTVAIRSDGSVESVTFVMSSGVAEVDDAIRRIVKSHEHYQAFPPALAREYDVIEIRRTWHFNDAVWMY